jgi:two-component system, NtrC family, sensor kinase
VHRTLRFQLIAIVVLTVAGVLALSQWVDTRFTEHALERDQRERALLALRTVESLWERSEPGTFAGTLVTLVAADREIDAIDIFRFDGDAATEVVTTRASGSAASVTPGAADIRRLLNGQTVTTPSVRADGPATRVVMPIHREGKVIGAAQAEISLVEAATLAQWLRTLHGVFIALSIVLISVSLALFLERRVARPVAALVEGMERAEAGALGGRVGLAGGGEFAFLAGSLNRMLTRIEELTAGLEARVHEATHALEEKNRELQEANEQLWQAQLEVGRNERLAALGEMAATIAHELGTPLNSILGYTQLLRREDLAPEHAERLAIVESQVQRMVDTIRNVLDRTRRREPGRAPVGVGAVVAEALALVSTRIAGRDIAIRNQVPSELPAVPADAIALRQVLMNLLNNAIDATEPPGEIDVTAAVLAPNGQARRLVEVAVADHGQGMPADEVGRVFEPFFTTKAPGRGTGLGLAIVDRIVRAHGGHIVVDSEVGTGTTMRVRLPTEE